MRPMALVRGIGSASLTAHLLAAVLVQDEGWGHF